MTEKPQTTDYRRTARDLFKGLLAASWELDAIEAAISYQECDMNGTEPLHGWFEMMGRHVTGAKEKVTDELEEHARALDMEDALPWEIDDSKAEAEADKHKKVIGLLRALKQLTDDEPDIERAFERYTNKLMQFDKPHRDGWIVENPPPATVEEAETFLDECDRRGEELSAAVFQHLDDDKDERHELMAEIGVDDDDAETQAAKKRELLQRTGAAFKTVTAGMVAEIDALEDGADDE